MDETTVNTIKLLIKDNRRLAEDLRQIKTEQEQLLDRLVRLEMNQQTLGSPQASVRDYLLDLPLTRILQVYHETPQLLEPLCYRVAINPDQSSQNPVLDSYHQGNYWVLQLRDQGFFLFPRPADAIRLAGLESLQQLFKTQGEQKTSSHFQFTVKKPAKLELLKRHQRWQLSESGNLEFGEAPLEFSWQQELRGMREQFAEFNQHLQSVGEAGLEATITAQRWQQSLAQAYGNPVSIVINTFMPIAYVIYKGPVLVPCNIITGKICMVLPAWDRGLPWEQSIYAEFHSKSNKNVLRSRPDHPILPNQPYLIELKEESQHTWAIANSYEDASRIVTQLHGHWGPLA